MQYAIRIPANRSLELEIGHPVSSAGEARPQAACATSFARRRAGRSRDELSPRSSTTRASCSHASVLS